METIKSSAEISLIFKEGKRLNTPELSLIVLRNQELHDQPGRVAFIAGKKLGNAVWRNKAKRRMREIYKAMNTPIINFDVLFIAKKQVCSASFHDVLQHVVYTLEKAHVI